ncbi:MAG: 4-hydroxy-tetrahydrodipicolinate synthase [Thermomicrobiales bacterium]
MHSISTTTRFDGSLTALITPFRHDVIDEPALRRLVDFQIENGTRGLVPCGTTGESATLTEAEQDRVIEIVIDQAAGRIPVIAGTGTNNTAVTIARTRRAHRSGADAALVVVPYYNKPTQTGLILHYRAIAAASPLPIILYNVPGRTGINMAPETIVELAQEATIVGVKEASGNLDQVSQIIDSAPSDFALFSGDDSLTLPIMSVGGRGAISVVANVAPAPVARLTDACLRGEFGLARGIHLRLFDLCRTMFIENNPTAVKTAAAMLGLCTDELRLPLTAMSDSGRQRLAASMHAFGLATPIAA